MKMEWKDLIVFGLASLLVTGLMTRFEFGDVEVQMHDIYFVIGPIKAVIFFTCIFWIIKNAYLVLEIITERYKILAIFLAIINPLVALFIIILTYLNVKMVAGYDGVSPDGNFTAQIIPVFFLIGLIGVQTAIQIRVLKKLRIFLK